MVGINGDFFVYFDPNDANVSKIAYVRTKLQLKQMKKMLKQCENKFFRFKNYDLVILTLAEKQTVLKTRVLPFQL